MQYTEDDLKYFSTEIWEDRFQNNMGGMGAPDLFSLYFTLNKLKPKVVVESGVWNGISTKLIRKVLPEATIICLDPMEVSKNGYKDLHTNTKYYLGKNFIDFNDLDLSMYAPEDVFCFFDCHQNAYLRISQCNKKKITNILFNDNYPAGCGSHYTIEHAMHDDTRHYTISEADKKSLVDSLQEYHIFPNIYPGQIKTGEGLFDCKSYFSEEASDYPAFVIFKNERNKYRWNTFIQLKSA